jgi:hypothetical protein
VWNIKMKENIRKLHDGVNGRKKKPWIENENPF